MVTSSQISTDTHGAHTWASFWQVLRLAWGSPTAVIWPTATLGFCWSELNFSISKCATEGSSTLTVPWLRNFFCWSCSPASFGKVSVMRLWRIAAEVEILSRAFWVYREQQSIYLLEHQPTLKVVYVFSCALYWCISVNQGTTHHVGHCPGTHTLPSPTGFPTRCFTMHWER
jgi:hypothetical protein